MDYCSEEGKRERAFAEERDGASLHFSRDLVIRNLSRAEGKKGKKATALLFLKKSRAHERSAAQLRSPAVKKDALFVYLIRKRGEESLLIFAERGASSLSRFRYLHGDRLYTGSSFSGRRPSHVFLFSRSIDGRKLAPCG